MKDDNELKTFEELLEELLEEQDRLMKSDNKLKTFEELLEEQEEAMKDPKYKEYEKEIYSSFCIPEKDLLQPTSKLGSKFDRELLKKQLDYMANDVLLVNDIGYGGVTMIRPYVGERINVNPVDDARNIVSLKEMLNKQFGKDGLIHEGIKIQSGRYPLKDREEEQFEK